MRSCTCGMPNLWGISWTTWHRLHITQHLAAYPNLDERSKQNLTELADLTKEEP
jgi:hypothetical protein